jgi:hypothetical protein
MISARQKSSVGINGRKAGDATVKGHLTRLVMSRWPDC